MTDVKGIDSYERLLANVSWKVKRFAGAQGVEVEFDDLFQEARITYFRAIEKFDPSFGVQFSTYLYKAATQNLRNLANKVIILNSRTSSLDASIGEDDWSMHDILPSDGESMSDRLDRLETEATNFHRLSLKARNVIALLDSPPPELRREVLRMQAFRDHCKSNGMAAANRGLNVETICTALGYDRKTTKSVKAEFNQIMETVYGEG